MRKKDIHKVKRIGLLHLLLILLAACSSVGNFPEGEVLYSGIKEIAFDKTPKDTIRKTEEGEGVITALVDAYNTVEGLLTGSSTIPIDEKTRKLQEDSLKEVRKLNAQAYATAKSEVEAALAYAPNGSFMGSSSSRWPIRPRMWIYKKYLYSQTKFGKWMFDHFAATPRFLSNANPEVRTQVAKNTLKNYGYLRGTASYDIVPRKDSTEAKVFYSIHPAELFSLDSISYLMFPPQADSIVQTSKKKTLLHRGNPFSIIDLDGERSRLSAQFRNNGYYFFQPEYIVYRADTLQHPLKVQLQVQPSATMPEEAGKQYYMGNTYIRLMNYNDYRIVDTIGHRDIKISYSGTKGKLPLHFGAMRRFLFYRKGDLYRQGIQQLVQNKLVGMGIFSQFKMNYVPRGPIQGGGDTLDVQITAMLDKPYDAEFEGKITTKSNGQVGPGASFSMSKKNAFRGAETLGLDLWGSYEWQTGAGLQGKRSLINSYEYGTNVHLVYPRFMLFGLGKKLNRHSLTSTTFQIDAKWLNRANYFNRVSFGARVIYDYQRKRNVKNQITPFRLDYAVQLHTTERFDSIVNANQSLYVSMRNQFVPCMEYTYTWTSLHHAPRTFIMTAKEAGNLVSGIYSAFGESWTKKNKELFSVPFAQYLKLTAQYTHKFRLTEKSCIATRAFGGCVWSYGNSTIAPYNDLFSIGGANSIRAFAVRSIGPGAYHPRGSSFSYIDEMGDLKLEANVEYRFPLVANLYGAVFLDAGNVWLMHKEIERPRGNISISRFGKDIALGTGVGIRYDLDIFVIRFDLGIGLHAPYDSGNNGYYNMPNFGKSLGYHLAIGYPF